MQPAANEESMQVGPFSLSLFLSRPEAFSAFAIFFAQCSYVSLVDFVWVPLVDGNRTTIHFFNVWLPKIF